MSLLRNVLNEQRQFAPITTRTSAVVSIAGTDNGMLWSVGFLRSSWMPDPAPAEAAAALTLEQHKHKQQTRLLAHASRLAVAQTWALTSKGRAGPEKRGHVFLIAGPVDLRRKLQHSHKQDDALPDPESTADPDDWSFGLQIDIIKLEKTKLPGLHDLSCTRSLPQTMATARRARSSSSSRTARGVGHADV